MPVSTSLADGLLRIEVIGAKGTFWYCDIDLQMMEMNRYSYWNMYICGILWYFVIFLMHCFWNCAIAAVDRCYRKGSINTKIKDGGYSIQPVLVVHVQSGKAKPVQKKNKNNRRQNDKKNNTPYSNVVPHRSTKGARSCLTSLSRREAVLS